jgi:hypothetical protein
MERLFRMVTLIASCLLLGIILMTLYFFGAIKSPYFGWPYFGMFRLALYLLLTLLAVLIWYGAREQAYEGYDPTVNIQ